MGLLLADVLLRVSNVVPSREFRLEGSNFAPPGIDGIPWMYRPGVPGVTNELGLRDPVERALEKPAGTFRILVVGDSVTAEVMDVAGGDVRALLWPARLESILSERLAEQTRVEVLNLSSPGLSLRQYLLLVEDRGLALSPDLVVFAFCFNDPVETDIGRHRNQTPNGLLDQVQRARYDREQAAVHLWYAADGDVRARLADSFAEVAALARRYEVMVVALPRLVDDLGAQEHIPVLTELSEQHGVVLFDPTPALLGRLHTFRSAHSAHDDLHMTAAGHEALAVALAEFLGPRLAAMTGSP